MGGSVMANEEYKYLTHCTTSNCPSKSTCYRQTKSKTLTDSNFDFDCTKDESFVENPDD